jgi:hypothetical protein
MGEILNLPLVYLSARLQDRNRKTMRTEWIAC